MGQDVPEMIETHYTVSDVAEKLNLSTKTVKRYIRAGKFSGAILLNGGWRIPEGSLIHFIREAHQKGKASLAVQSTQVTS